MSKHSKNNTATAVFTYNERKKLKNTYGTIETILESDLMKPFNCCCICLKKLDDPLVCTDGHIFCKKCLMGNLLFQKKMHKRNLKNNKKQLLTIQNNIELNKRENNEKNKYNYNTNNSIINNNILSYSNINKEINDNIHLDIERKEFIERELKIKELKEKSILKLSNNNIDNNFWVKQDNNISYNYNITEIKDKLILKCPGDNTHIIKLKYLHKPKFKIINNDYLCEFCSKELKYQKIILITKCGHVICKTCIIHLKDKCICDTEFNPDSDIIQLIEQKSGYSNHNDIIGKRYAPQILI